MNITPFDDSPFQLQISFHGVIEHLEQVAASNDGLRSEMAREVLKEVEPFPELRDGITDGAQIEDNATVVKHLLADLFPEVLTNNEIKAVTIPFQDILFNPTKRFQRILEDAGPSFDIAIRDFSAHQFYVMSCCLIISEFYGRHFDFSKPMYYDIPTADGIIKHYRILYNGDFIDIIPTEKSVALTSADIDLLTDNYNDLDLWKRFFPKGSWILKGFGIVSLYDATVENAVSALKGTLLGGGEVADIKNDIVSVFRSIYKIPDLRVGFTAFESEDNKLTAPGLIHEFNSFLLKGVMEEDCSCTLCGTSFAKIITDKVYYAVSDVKALLLKEPDNLLARRFHEQDVQSFIMAPVVKNDHLLGILELVSSRPLELNSINANRLEVVMPFITDTIDRKVVFLQNYVQALIQNEYTAMHPSVYWKFRKEALKYIRYSNLKKDYAFKEIAFSDVYPLYGQIDIKGSSETRNNSVLLDLQAQLRALVSLLKQLEPVISDDRLPQKLEQLFLFMEELHELRADTEQYIQNYLGLEIHPLLKQVGATQNVCVTDIERYFEQADKNGDFHKHRRKYENSVSLINEKMAMIMDKSQAEAQEAFPHYYERFKTDGVEHNLYIGASISPALNFEMAHLYNLRLWQLQVLCQMELEHHFLKESLPYPLDVASLILAFSLPLSIRFRMDEKRFDVDGSYNARFEIVKKRIDKACIKGTTERITAVGKLTVVFSNQEEAREYQGYIRFLQSKNMLGNDIEMLEVEDLQGIAGLRAFRVPICYNTSLPIRKFYTYSEMLSETRDTAIA